jgi:hypothetical protein
MSSVQQRFMDELDLLLADRDAPHNRRGLTERERNRLLTEAMQRQGWMLADIVDTARRNGFIIVGTRIISPVRQKWQGDHRAVRSSFYR